jgi:hypothetical protein
LSSTPSLLHRGRQVAKAALDARELDRGLVVVQPSQRACSR